jgi:pimeloyl-ACP methyl ester carboxylesterase
VEGALRRRDRFESSAAAWANFAGKRPFSGFSREALDAYVACGFETLDDGSVRLRCRGEWEAAVYRQGLVHDGFSRLGRVTCPVVVASGDRGEAMDAGVVAAQQVALPSGRAETFAGLGHLGPLEDPPRVARSVAQAFAG